MLAHKLQDLRARRAAGETGFTLVELLVVVVIIVALAAIAVPIFLNQKDKADTARFSSDASSAGKVLAGAVSVGEAPKVTCGTTATLAGDTAGPCTFTFGAGEQTVSSDGIIKIVGWDASTSKWNAATACVQVTDKLTDPTATYRFKVQGGASQGTC